MEVKTLKLVMTGHGKGQVFINGEKVSGVTAFKLSVGVDCPNEATITVLPETVEVEGEFDASTIESLSRDIRIGPAETGWKTDGS